MLVTPLMSCSARIPIYVILIGAFFPRHGGLLMLGLYALGIVMAILMARLFSRFFMRGEDLPFVMELPPYRFPTGKAVFRHTWEKGRQYLKKMAGIILACSIVIWFLGYYPRPAEGASLQEQQANSYIGRVGQAIEPVMQPLGFDWKMSLGILTGVGAKELVVSTLGVMYAGVETEGEGDDEDTRLQQVLLGTLTPAAALSYLVFVLLYFPCIATVVAIKNESGKWRWALFTVFYTTALAYAVAFVTYHAARCLM